MDRKALTKFPLLFGAGLLRLLSGLCSLIGMKETADQFKQYAENLEGTTSDTQQVDKSAEEGAQQTINILKNLGKENLKKLGKELGITKDEMKNALSGMSLNTDLATKIKNNATKIKNNATKIKNNATQIQQQASDLEAKYSEQIEGILTYLASMDLTSSQREKYSNKWERKDSGRQNIIDGARKQTQKGGGKKPWLNTQGTKEDRRNAVRERQNRALNQSNGGPAAEFLAANKLKTPERAAKSRKTKTQDGGDITATTAFTPKPPH